MRRRANGMVPPTAVIFAISLFGLFTLSLSSCFSSTLDLPEAQSIDRLLSAAFKPDQPGAAVIVTRRGETIFRRGYGLADLEMHIPIEPDMVFRLGSVTKQFTAVAILMLEEQGKESMRTRTRRNGRFHARGASSIHSAPAADRDHRFRRFHRPSSFHQGQKLACFSRSIRTVA